MGPGAQLFFFAIDVCISKVISKAVKLKNCVNSVT